MRRHFLVLLLWISVTCFAFSADVDVCCQKQKAELGRALFLDPSLSADGTKSCASCHLPAVAFAENRQTSSGVFNRSGARNAPSLAAAAGHRIFFWDGRRTALEEAVGDPFFTSFEMGLNNFDELFKRLTRDGYTQRFQRVYGGDALLTEDEVHDALATFVRTLPKMKENSSMVSVVDVTAARRGRLVFFGIGQCSSCHQTDGGKLYTDDAFHPSALGIQDIAGTLPALSRQAMSVSENPRAIANAIGQTPTLAELGRFLVTREPADINTFRTPSLLHVARTAPYMHNGKVPTLEQAVDLEVYYRGLAGGEPLRLTAAQKTDLVIFLRTL